MPEMFQPDDKLVTLEELVGKIKLDLLHNYAHRSAEEQAKLITYDIIAPILRAHEKESVEAAYQQGFTNGSMEKDEAVKRVVTYLQDLILLSAKVKEPAIKVRMLDILQTLRGEKE